MVQGGAEVARFLIYLISRREIFVGRLPAEALPKGRGVRRFEELEI